MLWFRLLLAAALLAPIGCAPLRATDLRGTSIDAPAPAISLTAQNGQPFSLPSVRGRVALLFFGYTHCGDTCPAAIGKLATAVRSLGTRANQAVILFVTVDPGRDTPMVLARYDARFEAQIVGLTGSPAQVAAVERAYHVWAQRIPGPHGGASYDEAHASTIFLIDRSGRERVLHDADDSEADIAHDLRALLA